MSIAHSLLRKRFLLALLALALGSHSIHAQPRNVDLHDWLPADFGLALSVHRLRDHAPLWNESKFISGFRRTALGQALENSPEGKQLFQLPEMCKAMFGVEWVRIRDEVLGDQVVFVFSPGATQNAERGMILAQARSADLLADLIDRVNRLQKDAGELTRLHRVEHAGLEYFRREHGTKSPWFYAVKDGFFVLTGDEAWMKGVLDRKANATRTSWGERRTRAGLESALLTVAVNPAVVRPDFVDKKPPEAIPLIRFWRALDAIWLALEVRDEIDGRLVLQGRSNDMPLFAKGLFESNDQASSLWQAFPDDAYITLASKMDIPRSVSLLHSLLPTKEQVESRELLRGLAMMVTGMDLERDILAKLGPDIGYALLPDPLRSSQPRHLFALRTEPGQNGVSSADALVQTIVFLVRLHVWGQQEKKKDIRIVTENKGGVTVSSLVGDPAFPYVRPSIASVANHLLIASHPDAIRRFRPGQVQVSLGNDVPLARVRSADLGELLSSARAQFRDHIAQKNGIRPEDAETKLNNTIQLLRLVHEAWLTCRMEPGQFSLRISLKPK